MDVVVYLLLVIVVVGLFVTLFFFLKFMASFSSLIFVARDTGRDRPLENVLTSGFGPMWRVLRFKRNAHAGRTLIKHLAIVCGAFAATMGAAMLMTNLNTKHCVFSMTQTSSDGTEKVVCPFAE